MQNIFRKQDKQTLRIQKKVKKRREKIQNAYLIEPFGSVKVREKNLYKNKENVYIVKEKKSYK